MVNYYFETVHINMQIWQYSEAYPRMKSIKFKYIKQFRMPQFHFREYEYCNNFCSYYLAFIILLIVYFHPSPSSFIIIMVHIKYNNNNYYNIYVTMQTSPQLLF